jgi:hypothetical protein
MITRANTRPVMSVYAGPVDIAPGNLYEDYRDQLGARAVIMPAAWPSIQVA